MLGIFMPVKIEKEVHFTDRIELNPRLEKVKNGTKNTVRDQLRSLRRDVDAVNVKPEAYPAEFGPHYGSWEAECEAVVGETSGCQPWVTEVSRRRKR